MDPPDPRLVRPPLRRGSPAGSDLIYTLDQWRIAWHLLDDKRAFRRLMENVLRQGPAVSALRVNSGIL